MELYKYQGAGNDFLIADNRNGRIVLSTGQIKALCDRRYGIGADGLILLANAEGSNFRMVYYNADGSGGMMCGNGGRCIVAFAADCGLGSLQSDGTRRFTFEAPDGLHEAVIIRADGQEKTIRLKMKDVDTVKQIDCDSYFMDTGTRHFVQFVRDADRYDVTGEGRRIRHLPQFGPIGTNVNFVSLLPDGDSHETSRHIHVRTYEKGVEDETFACGTGIVASAIATYCHSGSTTSATTSVLQHYDVHAKRDRLAVEFRTKQPYGAKEPWFVDVWLIGPAAYVARIIV